MRFKINKSRLQILIVIVFTTLVYINIINNDFVWDDKTFILNWEEKRYIGNSVNLLKGDVPEGHEGVYRPVRSFFYMVCYKIIGVNKYSYHIFSILIHLCVTLLVYFIIRGILNKDVAFFSSLIFGIHPIHTESISYATSSFDIVGIIFLFLSLLFYIHYNKQGKRITYVFSLSFAILAVFTFEMTIVLPVLIIFYDLCINKLEFIDIKKKVKLYSPYFFIVGLYLYIRFFALNIIDRGSYLGNSFYYMMLTMSKALFKYVLLVIFPTNLTVDHKISEGIVSLTYSGYNNEMILGQSIFDLNILFSLAVILLLIYFGLIYYKKFGIISFSIGWFFISLLPVSNIIFIGSVMSEKYLYLASFGFCLLLGYFLSLFRKHEKLLIILLLIIFGSYSFITISRNGDWQGDLSLWSATIEKTPDSSVAHYNLGNYYYRNRDFTLAEFYFKEAINLNPIYLKAYNNLGLVFLDTGKSDDAERLFKKLIGAKPDYAEAYNNLGLVYANKGEYSKAKEMFINALEINPGFKAAKDNLVKVGLFIESE
ncbi:MAG: tetratricopeptide repeat protein [Candidatus Woesearchaeota archaeon]